MNKSRVAVSLAIAMTAVAVSPVTAEASSSFDMRKKVVGVVGIMNVTNTDAYVTRAEFAKMLVNASTYGRSVSAESNISVFADVDKNNEYAAYIRTAVEHEWMTGYLGGVFKPDEYITLQEAARALLALLGYTNDDFSGNQTGSRMAKFNYLELNDELYKQNSEILDKTDCINLFYNLLKTNTKENEGKTETSSTIYGAVLNCTLTSDGEINPLEMLDNSLKGPKVIGNKLLKNIVPFTLSKSNLFLNGEVSTVDMIESDENTVIYYNTSTRTVWAFNGDGENKGSTTGEITNIYYKSSDVMIPSSIVIDDGIELKLDSSDMQFAFSLYGDIRVGDEITVIWEKSTDVEGNESYTVVDYID